MSYIPAWAGMTIRQDWRPFHIPARPLLDSGLRRAATGVLPSRRIQDILSINDDEVLFWLSVILFACYGQGFSRKAGSPHLK